MNEHRDYGLDLLSLRLWFGFSLRSRAVWDGKAITPYIEGGHCHRHNEAADVSVSPATNADSVIPRAASGGSAGPVDAIHTGNAYLNVHPQTPERRISGSRSTFAN